MEDRSFIRNPTKSLHFVLRPKQHVQQSQRLVTTGWSYLWSKLFEKKCTRHNQLGVGASANGRYALTAVAAVGQASLLPTCEC